MRGEDCRVVVALLSVLVRFAPIRTVQTGGMLSWRSHT